MSIILFFMQCGIKLISRLPSEFKCGYMHAAASAAVRMRKMVHVSFVLLTAAQVIHTREGE